ncbi:MAG: hypothetical protein KDD22_02820, partial [Bdellovibrionales bacterium]|nr:hypothetical protein [Bdellovibrionales bacterium]
GLPSEGCRIESFLIRHPVHRKKFCSEPLSPNKKPKGKKAITHFKVLKTHSSGVSLIECRLETGRTHQIRIHMSERGLPLLGDPLYGSRPRENKLNQNIKSLLQNLNRVALHATELGFVHPIHSQNLNFKSSWPADLASLINMLEFSYVD